MFAASPRLRAAIVRVLNRVPRLKRSMKRVLARAGTIAAQAPAGYAPGDPEEALLSRESRRALRDLRAERAQIDAERRSVSRG
jgi:hypothetical protein